MDLGAKVGLWITSLLWDLKMESIRTFVRKFLVKWKDLVGRRMAQVAVED